MEYIALLGAGAAVIGAWLIYINQKRMQKEFSEYLLGKQLEISALYKDMEGMIDQFLEFTMETRRDIEDDKKMVVKLSGGILSTLAQIHTAPVYHQAGNSLPQSNSDINEVASEVTAVSEASERNTKRKKAEAMIEQGMPLNKIAKTLQMGTGEIQIIANLIKKINNRENDC